MTTTSKRTPYPDRVLFKIDGRRVCENNQQKCIDCLKPRWNKTELECKKYGCNEFYASKIIEDFYL